MDTLRGTFGRGADLGNDPDYDPAEDDTGHETPPLAIGQDERRMQVRAYNHWASLLQDRHFPLISDLDPQALPDFGPFSVLLDFSDGVENPRIAYLGHELAEECGATGRIERLHDVPGRSLLSRITDHYMQILANQAPIGFEAEFVNQARRTILYRGILLPYSSANDTIDFIFGVINWKELADQFTTDELLLEIDQVLGPDPLAQLPDIEVDDVLDLALPLEGASGVAHALPAPAFGEGFLKGIGFADEEEDEGGAFETLDLAIAGTIVSEAGFEADCDIAPDGGTAPDIARDRDMGLGDWLASARELALAAGRNEDRTRHALYAAISRAYDFSLAAAAEPEEFAELVEASGLAVQDRAPMTPVVKLVFGADYDKTRLTEYAAALGHGHRMGIGCGELAQFLETIKGGLKAVVAAERRMRREESGKAIATVDTPRERLARKLRKLDTSSFEAIREDGGEFGLVLIRRLPEGAVAMLGEVPEDIPLLERAARKLLEGK